MTEISIQHLSKDLIDGEPYALLIGPIIFILLGFSIRRYFERMRYSSLAIAAQFAEALLIPVVLIFFAIGSSQQI